MSAQVHSAQESVAPWLEPVHALLLLLPAAVLLWPGADAPLAGDPNPELTGAAIASIATIPALAMTLLRRAQPRAPWAAALLAFIVLGFLSLRVTPPSDTLAASRARLVLVTGFASLLSASSLGAIGRADRKSVV